MAFEPSEGSHPINAAPNTISGLLRQEETLVGLSFAEVPDPDFPTATTLAELREIRLQSYLRPLLLERFAPGHDEIRARGANRCTGLKGPVVLPAFPRAGLTGSSISSNRNRAAAGKIVCYQASIARPSMALPTLDLLTEIAAYCFSAGEAEAASAGEHPAEE